MDEKQYQDPDDMISKLGEVKKRVLRARRDGLVAHLGAMDAVWIEQAQHTIHHLKLKTKRLADDSNKP